MYCATISTVSAAAFCIEKSVALWKSLAIDADIYLTVDYGRRLPWSHSVKSLSRSFAHLRSPRLGNGDEDTRGTFSPR